MEENFRSLVQAAVPGVAVNWGEHPQGAAWPGIVLTVVGQSDGLTQKGPDGLWVGRVQVDAYAASYAGAKAISRALIGALNGYSGGGFDLISLIAATDGRESGESDATRPYRVRMDYRTVWRSK